VVTLIAFLYDLVAMVLTSLRPAAPEPAVTQTDLAPRAHQTQEPTSGVETIYFPFDSFNLSEQARGTLVKNADLLKKTGAAKIRVEGHCDERGSDEYNLALGEMRARQAMN
jgi:peptidoglycan-associated lipoprotein